MKKELIKKSFSLTNVDGGLHLVAYSKIPDIETGRLRALSLSSLPGFTILDISELARATASASPRGYGWGRTAWSASPPMGTRSLPFGWASGGSAGGTTLLANHLVSLRQTASFLCSSILPLSMDVFTLPHYHFLAATSLMHARLPTILPGLQLIANTGARTNGATTNNLQGVKHRHYKPCAPPAKRPRVSAASAGPSGPSSTPPPVSSAPAAPDDFDIEHTSPWAQRTWAIWCALGEKYRRRSR
ncbi:hypothetical protein B0H17DRAFT_1211832 [Mycena rosella]|uniref:Uncharacterized protein n=1 Tax=Mycena rosella TaxID=1033263 RepID=A0AAD7CU70_MYCRO|nr:hypothetical protein B0H17DRAFT_1211832 [Mycena rosella]